MHHLGDSGLVQSGRPGLGVILAAVGIHVMILATVVVLSTRARLPAADSHPGVAIGAGSASPLQSAPAASHPWSCSAAPASLPGLKGVSASGEVDLCRQAEKAIRAASPDLGNGDFHISLTRVKGSMVAELQSPDGHGEWRYLFTAKMDSVRSRERVRVP